MRYFKVIFIVFLSFSLFLAGMVRETPKFSAETRTILYSPFADTQTVCIFIPNCPCIGPQATVLSPLPCGVITGCERQEIRILARDNDTLVNPATVSLTINGRVYNYPSNIRVARDTIIYTPSTDWTHGDTIRYSLTRADDYWGCPLDSIVSCWFIVDTRPPEIVSFFPPRDTTITTTRFNVRINLADAPSGIDTTTFRFSVDGVRFDYPAAGLTFSGTTLTFDPSSARITFAPYDTVRFCLEYTRDRVPLSFCGPNELETPFCWNVYIDAVGPSVAIITPRPDSISACEDQEIRILLRDPSGIDPSSIILNINGNNYRINPPQLILSGDTLVFRPSPGFWHDNDTINIGVYARDRVGNGISPFVLTDSLSVVLARPGGTGPTGGLGFNGRYLLYVIGSTGSDSICVYDATTNTRIYARQTNIGMIYDIEYYNGFIYACGSPGRIFKLDTLTFSAIDTSDSNYGMGHAIGLTAGGGYIWSAYDNSTILRLDPTNLRELGRLRITPQPDHLAGLAWMCGYIVAYVDNNMLITIDPTTGNVTGTLAVFDFPTDTTGPEGLTYDGRRLWASNLNPSRRRIYGFTPIMPNCSGWNWFTDFSPPRITAYYPPRDTTIRDSILTVRVCLHDDISGLNSDSVRVSVEGRVVPLIRVGECFTYSERWASLEDTITACLEHAEDTPDYCPPNDTSFCWRFVIDRIGPVARIIEPLPGTFSACRDQRIIVLIDDASGVDTSSIRLRINSTTYDISSPMLFWRPPDSLIFAPPDTFWHNNDHITVSLLSANDRLGNPLQGAPINWNFVMDFAPPVHWGEYPPNGAVITEFAPTIGIFIVDSISGLDYEQIRIRIDTTWYNFGTRGIYFDDHTHELRIEPAELGISFDDGDTVNVCVQDMQDMPDYCPPNPAPMYCWQFRVSVAGPMARIIEPLPGTFSACEDQDILLILRDPDGVVDSTIELWVQGVRYTVDGRTLTFTQDTLRFNAESGFWYDGEPVNVQLRAAEDIYGNRLANTLEWSFTMDLSPPQLLSQEPGCGRWIADSLPTIRFSIHDYISGVRDSSVIITVNGVQYRLGHPALTRVGDNWQFRSANAGLVFHEGDSVRYCVHAEDSPNYCPPNILDTCCTFFVGLQGPRATLITPQPNTFTSCSDQEIIIAITDTDGVVPRTIQIEVSGRVFTTSSPEISWRNDTLIFRPSTDFNDGDTVRVRLISAEDTLGNPLQNPLDFAFIVDLTPPLVLGSTPEAWQVLGNPSPMVSLDIIDSLAGVDTSSIRIIVNTTDTFALGDYMSLEPLSRTLSYWRVNLDLHSAGVRWAHNDTAIICITALDMPDYCAPNRLNFCYEFTFDLMGPYATLITPPPGAISACVNQGFSFYLTDPELPHPIDITTLLLAVNDDTFRFGDSYLHISGDTVEFMPPADYWSDGELVEFTLLYISDIYGNPPSAPFSSNFVIDITPPYLFYASPFDWEEVPETHPTITFTLGDRISGVNPARTRISISINGESPTWYDLTNPAFTRTDTTYTFSTGVAGLSLSGGDTVMVCVQAFDSPDLCLPNELDTCWHFTIPIGGPRARIIEPLPDTWTACADQPIIILLRDIDGVLESSIRLEIEGTVYTVDSAELLYRNDTLRFIPSTLWTDGQTVEVALLSAEDIFGNALETPLNFSFRVDLSPPLITPLAPSPDETVRVRCPELRLRITDTLSGVNPSSIRLQLNGRDFYTGSAGVSWDGSNLVANICSLGVRPRGGDSVRVCINASDTPAYCPPNIAGICYNFYIESGGPRASIIQPQESTFVACDPETIIITLDDANGVDDTTIILEVNGRIYRYPSPQMRYISGRVYFTGGSGFFRDGERVRVRLLRADDILGNELTNPLDWTFTIDYSPPYIFALHPAIGSTVEDISPLVRFGLRDDLSGVVRDSIEVRINGRRYDIESSALWWTGDTVYFDSDSAGITFRGGDTVEVCVRAYDSPDYCGPNIFNTCYTFFIARGGPIATIIEPLPNTYSACESQSVVIAIRDTNGVNPASIRIRINGVIYTVDSTEITWTPPVLVFTPELPFADAERVRVELLSAEDSLGNTLETPLDYSFTMDLSPPVPINIRPTIGEIVSEPQPDIVVHLHDAISGLEVGSLQLTVNGTPYDTSSLGLRWSGDSLVFYPESLGISWRGGTPIDVCVNAHDRPDYCPPNALNYCWRFFIATGGPRATIIRPLDNTTSACVDQDIQLRITDPQGVNPSTIRLQVRDTVFTLSRSELRFLGDTLLIFTPRAAYWHDNETVSVSLLAAEDNLGNPLEAAPLTWRFRFDFSPPNIQHLMPPHGTGTLNWQEPIMATITDNLLGVDRNSIIVVVDGIYRASGPIRFTPGSNGLYLRDSIVAIYPDSARASDYGISYTPGEGLGSGLYFPEFATISIIIQASDRTPDYCDAHQAETLWAFTILDDDTLPPSFANFMPSYWSSDSAFDIRVDISDPSGVFADSVVLIWDNDGSVDDGTYHITPMLAESLWATGERARTGTPIPPQRGGANFVYRVCAYDNDYDFMNPRDRKRGCADASVRILVGPEASQVEPLEGTFTACDDQRIIIRLVDAEGVDTSSIILEINGVRYDIFSPELYYEDSLLYWVPARPVFSNNERVDVRLVSAKDVLGNPMREEFSFYFYVDLEPPTLEMIRPLPNTIVRDESPVLEFVIEDNLSGVNPQNILLRVQGRSFRVSDGLSWSADRSGGVLIVDGQALGISFQQGDTVQVELEATDNPNYCTPNRSSASWHFVREPQVFCDVHPNPFTPNDDGYNDFAVFNYPYMFTERATLYIFNTKNIEVFRKDIFPILDYYTVLPRSWNGCDKKGNPLPQGVYIYVIKVGGEIVCNGTVLLAR